MTPEELHKKGLRVRPLEWHKPVPDMPWRFRSSGGARYVITDWQTRQQHRPDDIHYGAGFSLSGVTPPGMDCASFDEAKSIADHHHAALIASCIEEAECDPGT